MIGFGKDFEKQCGEYLEYLYHLAGKRYNDCPDIDTLVQDTLTVLIVKISLGKSIEYPKGFLSAVLKNKYNAWLREKYKAEYVEYSLTVQSAEPTMKSRKKKKPSARPKNTKRYAARSDA